MEVERKKNLITYGVTALIFLIMYFVNPTGPILFVPVVFLIAYIIFTQRFIEAFVLANLLTFFMIDKTPLNTIYMLTDGVYEILYNESFQWIVFLSFCIGGLTLLLKNSGSSEALTVFLSKNLKTKKQAQIGIWIIGALFFIEDFLHCMVVGPATTPLAKNKKISKEMLTYIIKTTGVTFGMLLPMSMWSLFIAEQLEVAGLAEAGQGTAFYMSIVPFNFFAIATVIISLLVAFGIIPVFGNMKKAEELAKKGVFSNAEDDEIDEIQTTKSKPRLFNIVIPILSLVGFTFLLDFDTGTAAVITLFITYVLYMAQGLLSPEEFSESVLAGGIKEMAFLFMAVLFGLMFSNGLEALGFIDYVVELVSNSNVSGSLLPLLLFIVFSLTEFGAGLAWGLYLIVLPMIVPIAVSLDANMALCLGALMSASGFGMNCGFSSDMSILTSAFTNTNTLKHNIANLPYQLIAFVIAALGFLIAGYIL